MNICLRDRPTAARLKYCRLKIKSTILFYFVVEIWFCGGAWVAASASLSLDEGEKVALVWLFAIPKLTQNYPLRLTYEGSAWDRAYIEREPSKSKRVQDVSAVRQLGHEASNTHRRCSHWFEISPKELTPARNRTKRNDTERNGIL